MRVSKARKGSFYKHYKGGIYEVLEIALNKENMEEMVVYKDEKDNVWVRERVDFESYLASEDGTTIKRFREIE